MATETKEPAEELPENAETPAGTTDERAQTAETGPNVKKSRKGLFFLGAVIVVAGAAAAVPEVRQAVALKYSELVSPPASEAVEEISFSETTPAEEDIHVRLEQLENAREFDNAEVVASVEPEAFAGNEAELSEMRQNYLRLAQDVETLRDQLLSATADQNRRFKDLKDAMPQKGLIEERLLAMSVKEDALARQIAENAERAEKIEKSKADASAVLTLMARMDRTETKLRENAAEKERAAAILLALYQLREAALSGQPFQTERQTVMALASTQSGLMEKIQRLGFAADTGVWTLSALRNSYDPLADKAALSARLSPKTDWFHKALNALRELVIIRRIDAKGDDMSADAILARAGKAVNNDDIQTAVIILKNLQGEPAAVMKEWVTAAERYILAKQGINEAVSAALGVLYAKGE